MKAKRLRRLICLAEAASTNDWLKEKSELLPFTCVRAVRQLAGRGREKRPWFSGGAGENLAFSMLLPYPVHAAGLMPSHVALVVHKALQRWVKTQIKWPNDIVIEDRKLAGILCESYPHARKHFVVGIGINVATRYFPAKLNGDASSIAMHCESPPSVGELWLRLTLALWREFRKPRPTSELIVGYNRVAANYQKRRDYPGEILEFRTLLADGRAEFLLNGERLLLDQAM